MGYGQPSEILDRLADAHRWPVHADYRISDTLLVPAGRIVRTYDATQAGKLAGELVATGYHYGQDPDVILPFAREYGLLTGKAIGPGNVLVDSLEAWSKVRRHVELALRYLRERGRYPGLADDALCHVNDGLRDWLSIGVSKLRGRRGGYEFGYLPVGLAGVIFEQLAQAFAGVLAFKVCRYPACRKLFIVTGSGTAGRRKHAVYCSGNCKVYHYRSTHPTPARRKAPKVKPGGVRHSPR